MTDRQGVLQPSFVATWWDEAWGEGLWIAPWSKAVDGLTAAQAAWSPGPGRHSIWQIVNHLIFWREYTLDVLAGKPKPSPEVRERLNFLAPERVTDEAWALTRERFAQTQRRIREALMDRQTPLDRIPYHVPHDAYHVGQIMYLRAMQGLAPIE